MTGRERIRDALSRQGDTLAVDFAGTSVTGMHVSIVAGLREHFGLPRQPVKVIEPYQMLGEIDDALAPFLHTDTIRVPGRATIFGFPLGDWRQWRTPWGQEVLVPGGFRVNEPADGALEIYPMGDRSAPPSGRMPAGGFFFDTIIRQEPIDEERLDVRDNLTEFTPASEQEIEHYREAVKALAARRSAGDDRAAIFAFGGTALGDIAMVPAPFDPHPKGIRDVTEWYISTVSRPQYVREIFEQQTEIAIENLSRYHEVVGETPDVVYICGTDFGTQSSQFCSTQTFADLWAPYYRRINDWIHEHTGWKTFKHSCGAVDPLIEEFIECGFDILNPVQTGAAGMDPRHLKSAYGDRITFWGGGIDTQKTLPFGSPEQVRDEVRRNIELFAQGGGFVFNTIHNIQAKTPVENVAAMIEAIGEYR